MTREQILADIQKLMARVFDAADLVVHESTTAQDVAGWDSLNHTQLIAAVEEHFNVRFTLKELMRFQNVGDMCATIHAKLAR